MREEVYVLISKKQNVHDDEGERIAQVATSLLYQFDLGPSHGLITLPDLPLKLRPHTEHRSSTFATFLPHEADGYYSLDDEAHKEEHRHRGGELLWAGTKRYEDEVVSVVLEVTGHEDGARSMVVRVWNNHEEQEPLVVSLPGRPVKKRPEVADAALKDVLFHYYRGSMCGKCYGKIQEIHEYLSAAIVGFLSPFVLLGVVFIVIAVAVFLCCDLTRRSGRVQLPIDDEKAIEA
ncbi:hypothetical protein TRICI_002802 [Trichomonascus ciferrii]|uniref:Uncharacterized protein n=1 Tax=Trichomonascus ciferrii TaxID=44093 RepID=A0A642V6V0_9ASCO|nr:hypothetical protein TRICI_002802 [Trichomonascus ciferrii]